MILVEEKTALLYGADNTGYVYSEDCDLFTRVKNILHREHVEYFKLGIELWYFPRPTVQFTIGNGDFCYHFYNSKELIDWIERKEILFRKF